jgi:hypothetical protein
VRRLQANQKMNVVGNSACLLWNSAKPLNRTPDIFMQSFDPGVFDEWSAILRAVHDVIVKTQKRGHESAPVEECAELVRNEQRIMRGLPRCVHRDGTLREWAIREKRCCDPFGVGLKWQTA